MQIDQIKIHQILLPFSVEFSHSLRKRYSANNIIVEVIANQEGIKGFGEGAPRSYVTGESQESATKSISQFIQNNTFPWELNDISQIWDFIDSISNGKEHNSAICSIEMALLDALGKREDRAINQYFSTDFFTPKVCYGFVVPLTHKKRVMETCELIKKLRINDLRLKMGKDVQQNREAFETVKLVFGNDYDLRIDVNGAWDLELALNHLQLIRDYNVKVVEQPMMPDDPEIANFASAIKNNGIILMADESACSLKDIKKITEDGYYRMINVRLSKCGGFRNSLRIINHLRNNGVSFQIGCQLGESGLLSAGGRVLSLLCRDAMHYDGSYDEFLLKENITAENVTFGNGGEAGLLYGPGLGVNVSIQNLERLCDDSKSVTINRP